jgi:hypothetical protein
MFRVGKHGSTVLCRAVMSTATHEPTPRAGTVQTWRQKRRYSCTMPVDGLSTVGRACAWLLPWDAMHYPGILRGLRGVLGRAWHRQTLRDWRTGRHRCRPDVMLRLADEIERRCREGEAIARALRDEADAWRKFDRSHIGFLAVDPETGRNKRWRG